MSEFMALVDLEEVIKTVTLTFDKHLAESKEYPAKLYEIRNEILDGLYQVNVRFSITPD